MSWRLPRRSFLQPSTFYSSSFAPSRTFARVVDVETQLNGHSAHAGSTPAVNRNRRAKSLRVSTPAMATLTHLSSRSRLRRLRRRLPLTARTVGFHVQTTRRADTNYSLQRNGGTSVPCSARAATVGAHSWSSSLVWLSPFL